MEIPHKKLNQILESVLIAVVALTPLAFDPYCADSFGLPKLFLLALGSLALIGCIALKAIQEGRLPWKKSAGLWHLFLFIGVLILSTLASEAPVVGVFGIYGFRANGLIAWMIYAIFFWVGLVYVDGKKVHKLLLAIAVSSLFVSFYALLQYKGLDPFQWTSDPTKNRMWSTFGNPNFLGAYMAMILPASFGLLAVSQRKSVRALLLAQLLLGVMVVMLTQSRAAALGLAAGSLLSLFFGKNWRALASPKTGGFLLIGLLGIAAFLPWAQIKNRFKAGMSLESSNWDLRLYGWKAAVQLIEEKPLTGYGAEGYHLHFRKHMDTAFFRKTHQAQMSPVYPHNEILQVAVNAGLAGLVLYMGLLFLVLRAAWRSRPDPLWGAVFGLLVSVWINNQFSFHTLSTGFLFYLFAGALLGSKEKTSSLALPLGLRHPLVIQNAPVAIGCFLLVGTWGLLRIYRADQKAKNATVYERRGDAEKIYVSYEKASRLNPFEPMYLHPLTQIGLRQSQKTSNPQTQMVRLKKTEEFYARLLKINPLDAMAWNGMGTVHARMFQMLQQPLAEQAKTEFQKAAQIDPYLAEAWTNLGALYYANGNKEDALAAYLKAKEVNPYAPQVYYDLGVFHTLEGKFEEAGRYWREALEVNPNFTDAQRALEMLASGQLKQQYGGRK